MIYKEKLATAVDVNLRILFADNVVYTREYAKYGGYSGYKEFFVPTIAKQLADSLAEDGVTVQKHGQWMKLSPWDNHVQSCLCLNCDKISYRKKDGVYIGKIPNYCPNCGAKMDGADDNE